MNDESPIACGDDRVLYLFLGNVDSPGQAQ
jgi:hypothetical protein